MMAERMKHHPDWRNVNNRVEVTLTTHDYGALSENDVKLARAMDSVYAAQPR
jgi:4a-hydroxytetrahydrobiopterin dehydratase